MNRYYLWKFRLRNWWWLLTIHPERLREVAKDTAFVFIAIMLVYATVAWVDAVAHSDKIELSHFKTERMLATCLSGGALEDKTTRTIYLCAQAYEIKL